MPGSRSLVPPPHHNSAFHHHTPYSQINKTHSTNQLLRQRLNTMKTIATALLVAFSMLCLVSANFDIYSVSEADWLDSNGFQYRYMIFRADPDCKEVLGGTAWLASSDVGLLEHIIPHGYLDLANHMRTSRSAASRKASAAVQLWPATTRSPRLST
jgi:hypothetical protein